MMICAYDELYLPLAQRVMGDMYDFAVNTLGYDLYEFQQLFLISGISRQIGSGNPMYVAGMNGCEVAKEVIEACGLPRPEEEDIMYLDKSAEYWIGWALAYYQWSCSRSFEQINRCVPIESLYRMYPAYHEMDISHFVKDMDERMEVHPEESRLRRLRAYARLSQSQLAKKADVPLRQIQLFEQGQRDINKTQGETLYKLSIALGCTVEELLQQ